MAFKYPRRGVLEGEITSSFSYTTATGLIHAYRFLHIADGLICEIMLHTRNCQVQEEYFHQMVGQSGKVRLWPHKVRVTIASDALAFEVFEIEILE